MSHLHGYTAPTIFGDLLLKARSCMQVRAAPQVEDCMQYCGGLLRVLTSVKLDVSLAVELPDPASRSASGTSQPGQRTQQGRAGTAADAAGLTEQGVSQSVAGAAAASGVTAIPTAGAAGNGVPAKMPDALHFPLQHYDRVKSTLQDSRQLGMALLEGYDQIPQPTLDVYRCAAET